jgi:hypothetical protein
MNPSLKDVLEKAVQLQELVPGAVLVGGSAAALYAHHRESLDHDHVIGDLAERFDVILQNLEALGDWSTAKAQPGKIILGELDQAAGVLRGIDDYYADINTRPEAVATQLVRQLADPRPRDAEVTTQLASYKALDPRWHDWSTVEAVLATLSERIVR